MSWVDTYGKERAEPKHFNSEAEKLEFIKNERKLRTIDTYVTAGRSNPALQCKEPKRRKQPRVRKGYK